MPPPRPSTPPKSGAARAVDYLAGEGSGAGEDSSPLHGQISDLVDQYGLDAVQQALDECAAGGESAEPMGETGPEE